MADATTVDTATTSETEAEPQTDTTAGKDNSGDIPKEVQSALRKANKEAETLRLKLKEFEDRDKTEAQKLADRATQAEKERDEARLEALRVKVGAAKKLPADVVDLLKGDTEEELTAHADRLSEHFKQSVRPSGSVDQGPRGTAVKATPAEEFAHFIQGHMRQAPPP